MIEELTFQALVWYYFNILAITGIIFAVFLIAYNRSKRTIINIGESSAKDQKFPPFIKNMAIFGILFFAVREWGDDIYEATEPIRDYVGGLIDS